MRQAAHQTVTSPPPLDPPKVLQSAFKHPSTEHSQQPPHHATPRTYHHPLNSPRCRSSNAHPYLISQEIHKLISSPHRVRTLTGKEIELDIEPDYKVCTLILFHDTYNLMSLQRQLSYSYLFRSSASRSVSRRRKASRLHSSVSSTAESRCKHDISFPRVFCSR